MLGRIGRLDKEGLQTVIQRLARERSFLETLFNTIEDGVLVADETGRILYLNQAATRMLGVQSATAEGAPVTSILPGLDWPKLARFDRAGGPRVTRLEYEVSYPRPRWISLYSAPLDGEAAGSSGVALILHEREVRKLSGAAPAEGPRRGRHDGPPPPPDSIARLEQYLAVCKGEITRLDYIVTQFLQAIRPSPPQLRPSQLNEVVRETLDLLRPEIENRGITLKEKLSRPLPMTPCDPAQIKQALVNLIKNALQAMTRGGVLNVMTHRGVDGVVVSVADTGGGIPQEQLNRIFEPFYTTKKKGTGLGLMIVQRIVGEHRGRIEVDSHVGKGTCFRLWLPLHARAPKLLQAKHD